MGTATLALMLWFIWSGRVRDEPVRPVVAAAASAPTGFEVSALAVSGSNSLAMPDMHGSDEIELCGGLWVKASSDGSVDQEDLARVARLPQARERLTAQLRADSSEFAQAAAIAVALAASEYARIAASDATKGCETPECVAARQASTTFIEGRDALARMAAVSSDPKVYATAMSVCGLSQQSEGSCQLLSAAQWARLDPDNAAPWLYALTQAGRRRDTSAQNEALYRISASKRKDQYHFAISDAVIAHMPDDDASMPATVSLAAEPTILQAVWGITGYQTLLPLCKGAALKDWNRRQICDAVAELLIDRSDAFIDRVMGIGLGKQLGWPAERTDRLHGEYLAYDSSQSASGQDGLAGGCASARRDLIALKRYARLGEGGALHEWVALSGKRPEDFIRVERETQINAVAAAPAASAPSAPH